MMHKVFAGAIAISLLFAATPSFAKATPDKAEAALVLKKKKLAAEVKALELRKAKLIKSVKVISTPVAQPAQLVPVAERKTSCGSFFKCLFGKKKLAPVVPNASFVSNTNVTLSGKTSSQTVDWTETKYPVGSLIVKTPERALYFVSAKGEAIRYSIGVGREGMQWSGTSKIVAKAEWPGWTPPPEMIKREAAKGHMLPPFMEGGPDNPLGARAMYIGGRIYRVHGTNNEASIGGAVSSGCIRMMNADVIDLYDRVKIGAKIYVYQ
jgi:lipoprotein-anchoring transpeptidase ErfK/SrfK